MADDNPNPPAPQPNNPIVGEINHFFDSLNLQTGTIAKTPTGVVITGQNSSNQQVGLRGQSIGNFSSMTVSTFNPTTPQERRDVSKELYKQGMTQQQIANTLGVSQKTISNDLKK